MKYYVIVGEASGDVHGSKLLEAIKTQDPQAVIRFWGGDRMAEAAGRENMVSHYKEGAYMGIWEVAIHLRTVLNREKRCKKDLLAFAPDVVILIDYAGFNLRIAKFAKQHGIRTFFYIAPKVWAWKESRVKKIRKWVDELFVIFPFEIDYFAKRGIDAHYFGNPIVDEIRLQEKHHTSHEQFIAENGLEEKPVIALLAGSRRQEVEYNLPFMSQVASRFPDYQFVVAGVSWLDESVYRQALDKCPEPNIRLVKDKTYETLRNSRAAIVTSGTATLETALLGVPEVVCYWCSAVTALAGRILIKVPYISLVNIILNREAVKELIYKEMKVDTAVAELNAVLPGGARHERLTADYRELAESMGEAGVSERVAKKMIELLNCKKN